MPCVPGHGCDVPLCDETDADVRAKKQDSCAPNYAACNLWLGRHVMIQDIDLDGVMATKQMSAHYQNNDLVYLVMVMRSCYE